MPIAQAIRYVAELISLETPEEILRVLHERVAAAGLQLYGAWRLPQRRYDYVDIALSVGRTLFVHPSVPTGHTNELLITARERGPSVLARKAWGARWPFTFTEAMSELQPHGDDRWIFDLNEKYGLRDGVYCSVGNDWMVVFWSQKVLNLLDEHRAVLHTMAVMTAIALERLVPPPTPWLPALTAREIEVVRALSEGLTDGEIAQRFKLSEATVRTFIRRAELKLRAKTRSHAMAEAFRLGLIA
jgi:DNA-binding CsgD family transcriptional regulator